MRTDLFRSISVSLLNWWERRIENLICAFDSDGPIRKLMYFEINFQWNDWIWFLYSVFFFSIFCERRKFTMWNWQAKYAGVNVIWWYQLHWYMKNINIRFHFALCMLYVVCCVYVIRHLYPFNQSWLFVNIMANENEWEIKIN